MMFIKKVYQRSGNRSKQGQPKTSVKQLKPIESMPKGYEIIKRMGYKDGESLGKFKNGIKEPLNFERRPKRLGLGMPVIEKSTKDKRRSQTAEKLIKGAPKSASNAKAVSAIDMLPKSVPKPIPYAKAVGAIDVLTKSVPKPIPHAIAIAKEISNNTQTTSQTLPEFSSNDSNLVAELPWIALHFRKEIQLFQQHLSSSTSKKSCLLVAKILISNQPTTPKIFNLVRDEIVGWIGKYQHQGLKTPIFHDILNSGTEITIICDNAYAYEFLKKCFGKIGQSYFTLISHLVTINKMPSHSNLLHCYSAIYKGIIGDPQIFLTQVELHVPALEANNWIVVSHKVGTKKQGTHFILLLDAESALLIRYKHKNSLFICLVHVEFTMICQQINHNGGDHVLYQQVEQYKLNQRHQHQWYQQQWNQQQRNQQQWNQQLWNQQQWNQQQWNQQQWNQQQWNRQQWNQQQRNQQQWQQYKVHTQLKSQRRCQNKKKSPKERSLEKSVENNTKCEVKQTTNPISASKSVPDVTQVSKNIVKKTVAPVPALKENKPAAPNYIRENTPKSSTTPSLAAPKSIPEDSKDAVKSLSIEETFSLRDTNLSVQLPAIAVHFRKEIQLFQKHLINLYSLTKMNSCLQIAKICRTDNKYISSEDSDLIHDEIVGWIGKYQYQSMDTPIFHDVTNNETNITIVCENLYAYECLEKAVAEICKSKLLPHSIVIFKKSIWPFLDCYGAIYEGIIRDPDLFLTQINRHNPALEANHWIVVSHEVYNEKQETHFILIMDKQSALVTKYHYKNTIVICLHRVQFTFRGRIAATVVE